ncbi:Uncharacterised protein [Klebsiella pneumoniae]|nr:Uncharacterised protein [Klebsiella pneumoniae]SXX92390.1 Uncharacterised protein [Klebsiella pneumoniae]
MLHQHQVTPLLTLRYLQYLCELTQPRRHPRIQRDDIAAQEIDPALKAFGRHIARSIRKGRGVHIPAMNNTAFGQVLRTLELKRACN